MIVLGLTAITEFSTSLTSEVAHCFLTSVAEYNSFLERNFDGSDNSPNPLAQIFLSSKANNEVYTLKEMLLQPDREHFVKAMEEKVHSMFE